MIDGIDPDKLRGLLETEVTAYEFGQRQAAQVWESAAGYAPTIGILGAVLGLIHVMENLSDPSQAGRRHRGRVRLHRVRRGPGQPVLLPGRQQAQKHRRRTSDPVRNPDRGVLRHRQRRPSARDRGARGQPAVAPDQLTMARKRYDETTENHERWLISYADFITLLFAFFVVMYAISSVNEGKYKVFSDALGNAFGGRGAAPSRLADIAAARCRCRTSSPSAAPKRCGANASA